MTGEEIKKLRKAKGWNQKQLAEIVGTNRETVSNHERGKQPISDTKTRAYKRAFGLIGGDVVNENPRKYGKTITLSPELLLHDESLGELVMFLTKHHEQIKKKELFNRYFAFINSSLNKENERNLLVDYISKHREGVEETNEE